MVLFGVILDKPTSRGRYEGQKARGPRALQIRSSEIRTALTECGYRGNRSSHFVLWRDEEEGARKHVFLRNEPDLFGREKRG